MFPTLNDEIREQVETPEIQVEISEEQKLAEAQARADQEEMEDKIKLALKNILDDCEREDEDVRLTELRQWRMLQEYARGNTNIYWDETAADWRNFNIDNEDDLEDGPPRSINIFRAHMESVVAALSIKVPGTDFFPDDADSPEDIETAEGYTHASELIQKHVKAPLLLVKSLYLMWTQGTVFGYNYHKVDPKYGSIQIPQKEQKEIFTYDIFCEYCGNHLGSVKETKPSEPLHCSYCNNTLVPEVKEYPETIERIVGYSSEPKGRVEIDFFGPINVKVPFYARKQSDCGYLLLKLDSNNAMLQYIFNQVDKDVSDGGGQETYERYMRLAQEYRGEIPKNLNVVKCLWIRPWMFYTITNNEEIRDYLVETYPKGVYITYIDDKVISIEEENMDDHWTISIDPLSDYIHNEPLGKPLAPIQEMRDDLVDLQFKTVEYSISENFADPKVLDFDKYKNGRASPGMITQATPKAGQSIGDAFYSTTPAHLSAEVPQFGQQLDTDAQFVVGDFPSVYGGPSEGSKTAFEYDKSNANALQRLSLVWKRLTIMWNDVMAKSVVEFVENMKEDEKLVKRENGKFINVWIKKSQMTGKIGSVEPETNEQLPQSWEQKWHLITNLLQMGDANINAVLLAPENAHLMKNAVAMPEFYIPGDKDRTKQFGEIYDIIAGEQVTVDPDMDDHNVHMRVIKLYCVSTQGVYLYKTNPMAYQAIVQHYKEHQFYASQLMQPVEENQDVQE